MTRRLPSARLLAGPASPLLARTRAGGDVAHHPRDLAAAALAAVDPAAEGRPGAAEDALDGRRDRRSLAPQPDTRRAITGAQVEFRCRRGAGRNWRTGLCP